MILKWENPKKALAMDSTWLDLFGELPEVATQDSSSRDSSGLWVAKYVNGIHNAKVVIKRYTAKQGVKIKYNGARTTWYNKFKLTVTLNDYYVNDYYGVIEDTNIDMNLSHNMVSFKELEELVTVISEAKKVLEAIG